MDTLTPINSISTPFRDIINSSLSIDLCKAIDTLNRHNRNGYNTWYYHIDLNLVTIAHNINLVYNYHLYLSEKEAILIAQNYLNNELSTRNKGNE